MSDRTEASGEHEEHEGPISGKEAISNYKSLLENRNYRLWFSSSLLSALGDWVGIFALQVLVVSLAEPGSRLALFGLGGIMMARLLPSVLFGPFAGVASDRYDRKTLMVGTDFARGVLFVVIAFWHNLVVLFALTFFVECLSLIYMSAKDAALPSIVERDDLGHANQLNLLVTYGPLPFGAVVATLVTGLAALIGRTALPEPDPLVLALLLNAASFLIGALIIARLRVERSADREGGDEERETEGGALTEIKRALSYIGDNKLIRALIIGVIGVFFGAGIVVTLGPAFVRTSLDRAETDWFFLMTCFGGGLLLGLVASPFVRRVIDNQRLFPVALGLASFVVIVTSWLPWFGLTLVAGAFLGATAGLSFVSGYTLIHEHTDDRVRARTFAAFYTGTRISMFIALGLGPFVAGLIGAGRFELVDWTIQYSGIRMTMFFGGIVALAGAIAAGKGMSSEQS